MKYFLLLVFIFVSCAETKPAKSSKVFCQECSADYDYYQQHMRGNYEKMKCHVNEIMAVYWNFLNRYEKDLRMKYPPNGIPKNEIENLGKLKSQIENDLLEFQLLLKRMESFK